MPDLPEPTGDLVFPELTARPVRKVMTVNRGLTERRVRAAPREQRVRKARLALKALKVTEAGPETGNLYPLGAHNSV